MKETFETMIDNLNQRCYENNPKVEGDYIGDNELLYCGICNTPKQCRIKLLDTERVVSCLCKCAAARHKIAEQERKQRERQREINELRRMGFPESEMHKWTFEADDQANAKISKVAHNYVDNFEKMIDAGKGLLFYGTVGTGKTFYSACIVNALIDKGYPCMMTNFSRLVNTISGLTKGKQEYLDNLNKFDLLVIDDLAAERDTEYMNEIVQSIIDSRYRTGLPTIITTNLTAEEIKNPADIRKQRTFSRLLEMCLPVEVNGADRRRAKLVNDYAEFNDLLGL